MNSDLPPSPIIVKCLMKTRNQHELGGGNGIGMCMDDV